MFDGVSGDGDDRVSGVATVLLDTAIATPQSRTQGVVRLSTKRPRSWRVTLGQPTFDNLPGALANGAPNVNWGVFPTFAIVEWGLGAASFRAEVDWRQGTSFVLSAQTVNVQVQAFTLIGVPATPNPGLAQFPAMIAPVETLSPPTLAPARSIFSNVIFVAGSFFCPVPAYARQLVLHRILQGAPPENTTFTWWANAAATIPAGVEILNVAAFQRSSIDYAVPLPVPANACMLQVTNNGAALQSWLLEFLLGLG